MNRGIFLNPRGSGGGHAAQWQEMGHVTHVKLGGANQGDDGSVRDAVLANWEAWWRENGDKFQTPSWVIYPNGIVKLRGLIVPFVSSPGTLICTMPPFARPSAVAIFSVMASLGGTAVLRASIDVNPDGTVVLRDPASTGFTSAAHWLTLSGIEYQADQVRSFG